MSTFLLTEEKTSNFKKVIESLLEIAEAITYEEYRETTFAPSQSPKGEVTDILKEYISTNSM